jgi:hypothetical protein
MLKKLTGNNVRSHHGLSARKAAIPPCYWECQFPCEVEPGGERYVLMQIDEVKF